MNISNSSIVRARDDVFATRVTDDLVLFDPEKGKYFGTGRVGAAVWDLLMEGMSVEDIQQQLMNTHDVDRETCERELHAFLHAMVERGLIIAS
jgi:hypothetical protein